MQRFVGLCSQHEINTIVNTIGYYLSFPLSLLPLFLFITQCTSIEHAADTSAQSPPPQPSEQTEPPPLSPQEQLERFNLSLDRA